MNNVSTIGIYSVSKVFNNDLTTPMSAYLKLNKTDSFLLESVEKGTSVGRYSIIGQDPLLKVQGYSNYMVLNKDGDQHIVDKPPLDALNALYRSIDHHCSHNDDIPLGFYGYFKWDIIGHIEALSVNSDSDQCFEFQLPKTLIVFDHAKQTMRITISQLAPIDSMDDMNRVLQDIQNPLVSQVHAKVVEPMAMDWDQVYSHWSKDGFEDGVQAVKGFIKEGDIFQGVLSQKFTIKGGKSSLDVYRALRHINPSPYMFYFNYGDYHLIGSSPEILVKATKGQATLRPIAGTRKRHIQNDDTLITELKADEKEVAEHIMLVDLGRNDLGRVCQFDSVKVSDLMGIDVYSHVIHMVTNVTGELLYGVTPIDLIKTVFPAGTVSGAPKIRAIEIINQLEPTPRGFYSGAVGYFNLDGDTDFCIAIRTIVKNQHGDYDVQAGAGIVNDSVPENEYNETLTKAEGVLLACLQGNNA